MFAKYSVQDVILSIIALARLQDASAYADKHNNKLCMPQDKGAQYGNSTFIMKNKELINNLARYSIFASCAYGWKSHLALSGRLLIGDDNMLTQRTGVKKCDIVATNWKSKTHCPAYFIVRDMERKNIVLSIRGTLSPRDVLTDLCCNAEDFECSCDDIRDDVLTRAHQGMIMAAKNIAKMTQSAIGKELQNNPSFNLVSYLCFHYQKITFNLQLVLNCQVIVGHSLGAGVAACLNSMWENVFTNRQITSYSYGPPGVEIDNAYSAKNHDIISVVADGDPFATMSLGHLVDLLMLLSHLCINTTFRDEIMHRTQKNNIKNNLQWCYDTMQCLGQHFMTAEKLYPPGRIICMNGLELALSEAPRSKFRDILLHPHMLDVSRHVPSYYENNLQKIWHDVDKK